MEQSREITLVQIATILISTIVGVGVLHLPLITVQAANTGAPFLTFLASIIAFIGLFLITKLGMQFPEQTIIEYSEVILGKWIGRIYSLCVILFFSILTALASREFGEVVVSAVLKETPIEVTVIVMLLLAAIFSRVDLNIFAYIHNFYVPAIIFPALIIVVFSFKNANTLYLQPIFYPIFSNDLSGVLIGILTVAALFQGSFIISILIPSMQKPKKAMRAALWGMSISSGLYIITVIATLSVFGAWEMKNLMWPTLELARSTFLPGNVLQRLDVIFLAVWVTAVFTTILSSYMFTAQAISKLFNFTDHKLFSYFILPLLFLIAMIPRNVIQMYVVIKSIGRFGLIITIVFPALLLIIAKIRKLPEKREKLNDS